MSKGTSFPHISFEKKVRGAIIFSLLNSFGIISKINNTIFNPLKIDGILILLIKHNIFFIKSILPIKCSRTCIGLKLTSIMSIIDEKLHMFYVDMNDYWSIVLDVVLEIGEIV